MKRLYISKNLYMTTTQNKNTIYISITKKNGEEYFSFSVVENMVQVTHDSLDNKQEIDDYITVLKYLKNKLGYQIYPSSLITAQFVPIESAFMNYLMIRFSNCVFITIDNQQFVSVLEPFKENTFFNKNDTHKIRVMNSDYRSSLKDTVAHFLINSQKYHFINYLYDFYSNQIEVISFLKQLVGFTTNDDLRKLRIVLNYSPIAFLHKNDKEAENFIKIRLCRNRMSIDLFNNNLPAWNYSISGQIGSGKSFLMNAMLSMQLSKANKEIIKDKMTSDLTDLHLKFASKSSYNQDKVISNV